MTLVKRFTFLTIRVNNVYGFYILLLQKSRIKCGKASIASDFSNFSFLSKLPKSTCAPQGGEGSERQRAWVKTMAAVAATAQPDCLSAEGRTLLPRAWPTLLCPPRGRRERAPASVGKDNGGCSRDRSARLPIGRRANFAAESLAFTIVPPKGAKGASASERG